MEELRYTSISVSVHIQIVDLLTAKRECWTLHQYEPNGNVSRVFIAKVGQFTNLASHCVPKKLSLHSLPDYVLFKQFVWL